MPMRRAKRACPALIVIPGHFDLYEQFFQQIVQLCEETTPLVEPVSVGSAYLDLTGTRALHGSGTSPMIAALRKRVQEWLHVTFSAGIGANKTVARIASRMRKPAGQYVVPAGSEALFLAPMPVRWLEGIWTETRETLELAGVRTLGALARAPLDALQLALGRQALRWQRRAQGVDEDPVQPRQAQGPRWKETAVFPEEEWEEARITFVLRNLLEKLMARVREHGVEARQITLGLRYTDREETAHSITLAHPSDLECDFEPLLPALLHDAWKRRVRLRMVSLSASRIYAPTAQLSLFAETKRESGELRRLAVAVDHLRQKYGVEVIRRGIKS
jgi:DNA polymerase-4